MDDNNDERLHSVVLTDSSESKKDFFIKNEPTICCFSNKWWLEHTSPSTYKIYDENYCLCCRCLDCCTWCLEFQNTKLSCCKKNIVCFMCCCSITFQ